MKILYLDIQDMNVVFGLIKEHFAHHESIPSYLNEKNGLSKLDGVLKRVQMDVYYPSFYEKATYLMTQINKGHFFSNGNKRVALATTLLFIYLNNYEVKIISKSDYREKLRELFPQCTHYADFEDFFPEEFGYYNLSIIIADHERYIGSFEELKNKVRAFLDFSVMKSSESDVSMSG